VTFGFVLLTAGLVALLAGIKGQTIADTLRGAIGENDFWSALQDKTAAATGGMGTGLSSDDQASKGPPVSGGARGIVEAAAGAAGPGTEVVSSYRPGSKVGSGAPSDHASDDEERAARDIAKPGVDAIKGPPSPELDDAVVRIGAMFGRRYKPGKKIVDTFTWKGYRIQIIWRTPAYGGHMGHIHIGAKRTGAKIKRSRKTHGTVGRNGR
jgi:hypothetical protein